MDWEYRSIDEVGQDWAIWGRQYQRRLQKVQVLLDDDPSMMENNGVGSGEPLLRWLAMTPRGKAYLGKVLRVCYCAIVVDVTGVPVPITALTDAEFQTIKLHNVLSNYRRSLTWQRKIRNIVKNAAKAAWTNSMNFIRRG